MPSTFCEICHRFLCSDTSPRPAHRRRWLQALTTNRAPTRALPDHARLAGVLVNGVRWRQPTAETDHVTGSPLYFGGSRLSNPGLPGGIRVPIARVALIP
jgi:hypothetical protein